MKATVTWQPSEDGLEFNGVMDNGRTLSLDGNGNGLSPMESVLISVGACSSVDVVEIMRKSRQDMHGCYCELNAERAVQLSTEKYCSVMLMLTGNVKITTSFEVKPS